MNEDSAISILYQLLEDEQFNDLQELVFRLSWQGKTYQQIADESDYDDDYIRDIGFRLWRRLSKKLGIKVTKKNIHSTLGEYLTHHQEQLKSIPKKITVACQQFQDWGEVIDTAIFYGRERELRKVAQWIEEDSCRLVGVFGIGGVGKTAFAAKLIREIVGKFDYLIWRSVRNAPTIDSILIDIIGFLSHHQETELNLPENIDGKLQKLLTYLQNNKCLIILDNLESILQSCAGTYDGREGCYRDGYGGYGQLLEIIADTKHKSCLLVTGREIPISFWGRSGDSYATNYLQLTGLDIVEGKKFLQHQGNLQGRESERDKLINYYAGNPLALKIIAASIRELFNGNLTEFWQTDIGLFGDISDLLQQQCDRLSNLEQEIMYWLALSRELITIFELQQKILGNVSSNQLLTELQSLKQRSLVEKTKLGFTLQPLIMDFFTQRFIEQIDKEITTKKLKLLTSHALLDVSGQDYIKECQIKFFFAPLITRLTTKFYPLTQLETHLQQILKSLQQSPDQSCGYGAGNLINLLQQLKIDLTGYDFSNLTIWQADLQTVSLHQVNFTNSDLSRSVLAKRLSSIFSLAFSPDETLLASGNSRGEVNIWRIQDAKQMLCCRGHQTIVIAVGFSPDGKLIVSGSIDGTVKLWDSKTGECYQTFPNNNNFFSSVVFSPDCQTVASHDNDQKIILHNLNTGENYTIETGHQEQISRIAYSRDGNLIASGSLDGTIKLWNVNLRECYQTIKDTEDRIYAVDFHPNGKIIASGCFSGLVKLWHIKTGCCIRTFRDHGKTIWGLAFSADGNFLVTSGEDLTIKVWDINLSSCMKTFTGHKSIISAIAISRSGKLVASGGWDNQLKIWSLTPSRCFKTIVGYANWFLSVAFQPIPSNSLTKGNEKIIIASGSQDGKIRLWDMETGECLQTLSGHTNWVTNIAFSPDGKILASCGGDRYIKLWDMTTGKSTYTLQQHQGMLCSLHFSPDGKLLASASNDCSVKIWDADTGICVQTLANLGSWIDSARFSPDGKWLVTSTFNGRVKLWDTSTWKCLRTINEDVRVLFTTFSLDSCLIASGKLNGQIKFWDVSTGRCLQTISAHQDMVYCLDFLPDEHTLVSVSHDRTIKFWDIKTGECLYTLEGHSDRIMDLDVSHNGQYLATASHDETIKIWHIPTKQCCQTFKLPLLYEGMNISHTKGLTLAQHETLVTLGAQSDSFFRL